MINLNPRRRCLVADLPARLGIMAAACALAIAAGCHVNRPAANHARDQILYTATISDPKTFNPILVTDAASGGVVDNLFEGLVKYDAITTLPEPDLAESWEVGDDGKTITFHLRRDVKWDDGQPFTAHDVIFTMRVIYDPHVPNSIQPSIIVDNKPIAVAALDDHTVRMTLPRPFAPLLYAIGFAIVPAHLLEAAFKAGRYNQMWGIDTPPARLVGMGEFRMVRYVPSQLVQFQRNPDYWMKDAAGPLPRLKGQTQLIVQDQNAQYLRFLSGQIDVYAPRPEEVASLKEKASAMGITVKEIGIDTGSLFFSFNRNPRHYIRDGVTDPRLTWFTDIHFLRALAHAVDKQAMINLCFQGLAKPATADISPANTIFHNPNLKDYDYDLALAAHLLDAAGYRLIRPGVRADPQGHPLVFSLTTNTGVQIRDQMCVIFQQDLAKLGIRANYRPLEFTTLVEKLDDTFDWDCVLIGFTGTIEPNNASNFLRSSGNLHIWDPSEPKPATPWEAKIDQLLDQGTMVMDPKQRAPYYWQIQQILHDQLPIIETVREQRYDAWKDALENYRPTVWGLYKPELIQFRPE
ncbi:MAG TPA: ABC transporter substrate-binding protein [Candidatus Binataceae bacterium]|nr:ABC transporter substrate-binding protein [Candidatus Binataceae bacterium]